MQNCLNNKQKSYPQAGAIFTPIRVISYTFAGHFLHLKVGFQGHSLHLCGSFLTPFVLEVYDYKEKNGFLKYLKLLLNY